MDWQSTWQDSETISLKFHPPYQELRGVHPKTKGNTTTRKSPVNELQYDFIIHQSTARGHTAGIVRRIPVEIEELIGRSGSIANS
jgi:hypothetical protein